MEKSMEKMIKRAFFVGLGMTIIVARKAGSLVQAGSRMIADHAPVKGDRAQATVGQNGQHLGSADASAVVPAAPPLAQSGKPDDLTTIKGIGPTYAKRLREAGITSFAALATQSPEHLAEVTRATGSAADPVEWIAEARALASFFSLE